MTSDSLLYTWKIKKYIFLIRKIIHEVHRYTLEKLIYPCISIYIYQLNKGTVFSVRTLGVVTLGLLPPMAPGRMEPVSL